VSGDHSTASKKRGEKRKRRKKVSVFEEKRWKENDRGQKEGRGGGRGATFSFGKGGKKRRRDEITPREKEGKGHREKVLSNPL